MKGPAGPSKPPRGRERGLRERGGAGAVKENRAFRVARGAFLLLLAASVALPLYMTVSVSLQTMPEVYAQSPVLVPARPQFHNYAAAMNNGNWPRYFLNSGLVTLLTVAISLFINAMSGFVFARVPFRGRNALFLTILLGMMVPPQVTLIPVFTLLKSTPLAGGNDWLGRGGSGLINTHTGLILPFVAGSFGVFLCRQFYLAFPAELDDAARIDGCGRFSQFVRVYLPLSGPVLASLGILKFTGTWNEYTWPLVITSGDAMKTVQLALASYRDEAEVIWNQLMAATLIAGAPIYIAFFFAQKHFVSGLLAGSVKG
ncbi:MAG: carbohydrate ABC transporter permease [Clostridiales bacterium]|nr:carbohydrate ABC transporter permease [Clostridiales bacterium]